ncbi:hypothetical protein GCM10008937_10640 [Deinococcus depolymerans]|uniref:Uncharacterized protein n=1 Tax=Deinococcus depolymerans TaxID=392408 RepID=A0ABP3LS75_9DEIO
MKFRIVGETNGIRIIRTRLERLTHTAQAGRSDPESDPAKSEQRRTVGRGVGNPVVFRVVNRPYGSP